MGTHLKTLIAVVQFTLMPFRLIDIKFRQLRIDLQQHLYARAETKLISLHILMESEVREYCVPVVSIAFPFQQK